MDTKPAKFARTSSQNISSSKVPMHSYIKKEDILVSIWYMYLVLYIKGFLVKLLLDKKTYFALIIFGKLAFSCTAVPTTKLTL